MSNFMQELLFGGPVSANGFDLNTLDDGEKLVQALNRLNDAAEYCGRSLEAQAEKWLSHPLPPARRLAAMLILESALRRAENESCCIAPDGCGWIAFLPGWALGEGVVPGL